MHWHMYKVEWEAYYVDISSLIIGFLNSIPNIFAVHKRLDSLIHYTPAHVNPFELIHLCSRKFCEIVQSHSEQILESTSLQETVLVKTVRHRVLAVK